MHLFGKAAWARPSPRMRPLTHCSPPTFLRSRNGRFGSPYFLFGDAPHPMIVLQRTMTKILSVAVLFIGFAGYACANVGVPEIDASSGVAALTLLSGALLVFQARRRTK